MSKNTIQKLFILSKQDITIEGIRHVLESECDYTVVACVEPGDSCLERFRKAKPDLLFLHHEALNFYPFDITSRLREHQPHLPILLFGRELAQERLLGYLRGGQVQGYLCEHMQSEDWLQAVKEVTAGRLWLDRGLMDRLVRDALALEGMISSAIEERLDSLKTTLTGRELEILQLVLEGLPTREIAQRICLSEQSVKLHLSRLFRKLDVNNRSQMIVAVFQRVCPVSNVIRLIHSYLDKRRLAQGRTPLIKDPLTGRA